MRNLRVLTAMVCLAAVAVPAAATTETYMLTDHWGGTWADAEKVPPDDGPGEDPNVPGTADDYMCWAAVASNLLEWTGWGKTGGMTTADDMFAYFQDHWTDQGGNMYYGWDWWFDGTNDSPGDPDEWSQVDVPGGGFYPSQAFSDYYLFYGSYTPPDWLPMLAVDVFMGAGYGVALSIAGPTGHAVTCWGFDYDTDATEWEDYYTGIWVTDSDDDKNDPTPEDELQHYSVNYAGGVWHLNDYPFGDYHITEVHGLAPIPEPVTLAGLVLGIGTLAGYLRRRQR